MKLSTRIRYGVRALMDIAEHGTAGPVSLKDVARRQGISEQYLEQLALLLKGAGLIRSIRGAHGGFVLSRQATEIRLSEIVEILGGPIKLVDCLYDQEVCTRADCCAVRDVWREANEAFRNVLAAVTLADLVERQRKKLDHLSKKRGIQSGNKRA
ncbi:transcriptional regulator, BadM/Rrf2 family [Ammonifex degensii KC4]|uniref:Transcriptional regulator, BadM/Rrf2 family n=1 Tax=Ammonifex degensii (strain DSM 10501 / KC4) TaxID=429009 RepID=C9RBF1_AMMDK|nr:Rrf2 family transcriptional regulator [Ammonifex degensii]ACX51578.1 transcriptional regulator, BadM/Rrf2 family [Ammonifex degensii KC4]